MKYQRCSIRIKKKYVLLIVLIVVLTYWLLAISHEKPQTESNLDDPNILPLVDDEEPNQNDLVKQELFERGDYKTLLLKEKLERLEKRFNKSRSIVYNSKPMLSPNYNVHIFYYAWYKSYDFDGEYAHWNHKYLDNWKKEDSHIYPSGRHKPPNDIGSNYYPLLGCYSSNDPFVIETHLQYLRDNGIGVLVISWAPPNTTDSPTEMMPILLDLAQKYAIKVALHVEPYEGRNPINMMDHLRTFFTKYGQHEALYTQTKPLSLKRIPVVYVYDSYLIPAAAWKEVLGPKGDLTVRGTKFDAIFLGLLVEVQHKQHIKKSAFNGFYTYFATNSFTYGSTWKNWATLSKWAQQNGLIFVPSVGPGYVDTRVRAWNGANTRNRLHGQYYDVAWRTAINSKVSYVSITSFNEWHEGTQVEPAVSKMVPGFSYLDYGRNGPFFYLNLTKSWIQQFEKG